MKDIKNKEMEMKNSSTQSNELNDDDLDNVAGGQLMAIKKERPKTFRERMKDQLSGRIYSYID